MMLIPLSTIIQ